MRLMRALMLTLALLPLSALALQAPPNVHCTSAPVPPGSSLSLVASQIAINGLPMAIVAAHSTLPPQAFLQFYATAGPRRMATLSTSAIRWARGR